MGRCLRRVPWAGLVTPAQPGHDPWAALVSLLVCALQWVHRWERRRSSLARALHLACSSRSRPQGCSRRHGPRERWVQGLPLLACGLEGLWDHPCPLREQQCLALHQALGLARLEQCHPPEQRQASAHALPGWGWQRQQQLLALGPRGLEGLCLCQAASSSSSPHSLQVCI